MFMYVIVLTLKNELGTHRGALGHGQGECWAWRPWQGYPQGINGNGHGTVSHHDSWEMDRKTRPVIYPWTVKIKSRQQRRLVGEFWSVNGYIT